MRFLLTLALCATMAAAPVLAQPQAADIEQSLQQQHWRQAAQQMLQQAATISPQEFSVALAWAAAGQLDEAVRSVPRFFETSRAPLLLDIAKQGTALPAVEKIELTRMALASALEIKRGQFIASGILCEVSLALVDLGAEDEARRAFESALAAADRGLGEDGSGAYRGLSSALAKAPVRLVRPWMLAALATHVPKTPQALNLAFTAIDLASVRFKLGQRDAAVQQLDQARAATTAAAKSPHSKMLLQAARDAAARTAAEHDEIEWARRHGRASEVAPDLAAFHARHGNQAAALAVWSALDNDSLYASARDVTALTILTQALEREDAATASFYARRFADLPPVYRIKTWTRIGQLLAKQGARDQAAASFWQARAALESKSDVWYDTSEVSATVGLAQAQWAADLRPAAKDILSTAVGQLTYIPQRRRNDQVTAGALVADALVGLADYPAANQLLVRSHAAAQALPEGNSTERRHKAQGLSQLAGVAFHLAASAKTMSPVPRKK